MAYKRNTKHGKNNHRRYDKRDRNKKVSKMFVPKSKRPSHVTVVPRPNEDPARTIKRFLKKCKKERIVEKCREKSFFVKPSERRRIDKEKRERTLKKLRNSQN